jgi:hypothetical protein
MFEMITLLLALTVGFAAGYAVRDLKSRRRRASVRAEYVRTQDQKHYKFDSETNAWRVVG